jgi:membrane associated rhomboid family serine protease
VAFSYERVVTHREWWRVLTASHAHFDPFHLLFNVMALWCVRVRD